MDEAPRRGRPRSQATHDAILDAVRDILVTGGYAEVSMDRVASIAGVGRQSLYRRWPSKAPLVAEAVLDAYGQQGPLQLPDTGDIEADLRSWLHGQAGYFASERNVALSRALAVASADNPLDNEALDTQLAGPHRDALLRRLKEAATVGDVREDVDVEAVAEALIGATLYRILNRVRTFEETTKLFDGLVDALIVGLRVQH
jgi:AcrR family transcriptional regulator